MAAIDKVFDELTEGQHDWDAPSVKCSAIAKKLSNSILDVAGFRNPTADQTIALAGIIIKERGMRTSRNDHDRLIETLKDLA